MVINITIHHISSKRKVLPVESLKVGADVSEDGLDDGLGRGVAQSGLQANQLYQVAGVATNLGEYIQTT